MLLASWLDPMAFLHLVCCSVLRLVSAEAVCQFSYCPVVYCVLVLESNRNTRDNSSCEAASCRKISCLAPALTEANPEERR